MTLRPRDQNAPLQLVLRILPAVAAFSATSYALGRLYLEAYFEEFGIPQTALHFNNQDYLFASLDMTVLSGVYVAFLWFIWSAGAEFIVRDMQPHISTINRWINTNVQLHAFPHWPQFQFKSVRDYIYGLILCGGALASSFLKNVVLKLTFIYSFLFVPVLIAVGISNFAYGGPSFSSFPGIWGLITGLLFGLGGVTAVIAIYRLSHEIPRLVRDIRRRLANGQRDEVPPPRGYQFQQVAIFRRGHVAAMLIIAIAFFPFLSQDLAVRDAKADVEGGLPTATVVVKQSSPTQEINNQGSQFSESDRNLFSSANGPTGTEFGVVVVLDTPDAVYVIRGAEIHARQGIWESWVGEHLKLHTKMRASEQDDSHKLNEQHDEIHLHEYDFKEELLLTRPLPRSEILSITYPSRYSPIPR